MRLYTFGNFYLSSIQQGIQGAHTLSEMVAKYSNESPEFIDIVMWAANHKTIIALNGGMASDLRRLTAEFDSNFNPYAWAMFTEEQAALEGSITSVGIVLPEKIYKGAEQVRDPAQLEELDDTGSLIIDLEEINYSRFEFKLMKIMNKCPLAR